MYSMMFLRIWFQLNVGIITSIFASFYNRYRRIYKANPNVFALNIFWFYNTKLPLMHVSTIFPKLHFYDTYSQMSCPTTIQIHHGLFCEKSVTICPIFVPICSISVYQYIIYFSTYKRLGLLRSVILKFW